MGMFGQLGALFWKNILIRRRHPTYIVLEFIWPVILFVVLVLMRLGSPPDHRQTCEFQERDLPSSGLMPFLQSSVCTLNNNCSTREWAEDRSQAQYRFQALIRDIDPLISKESTVEALKALPTVTKVLNNIKEIASPSVLDEVDNKLMLKNVFRNPDQVVDILSDKYNILDRRVAEALLDATLNPLAFISSFGTVNLKDVVCDPSELERFIILSNKNNQYIVNKFTVSNSLCKIPDDLISDVTNEIVRQLDVANIIRLGKDLAGMTGAADIAQLMSDLADLTDMYMESSNLFKLMESMPDLSAISEAMREFGKLVPLLSDMNDIDFGQISALLDFVSPMLESVIEDPEMFQTFQSMIKTSQEIISSFDSPENMNMLMEQLPNLMDDASMLESSLLGLGLPLSGIPVNNLYSFMNMIMNNTLTLENLSTMSLNDTFDYIEVMFRTVYGTDSANIVMAIATNVMEMMTEYTTYTNNIEEDLISAVSTNDGVVESLNSLNELGEDVTYNVITEVLTVDNIYGLTTGEMTSYDVCEKAVTMTYSTKDSTGADAVVMSVCTTEATQAIDQVFVVNNHTDVAVKLTEHMSDMEALMDGTIPPHQHMMALKDMYVVMMEMMTDMFTTTSDNDWMTILANTNIDIMSTMEYWHRIDERYRIQTSAMLPLLVIGRASESSPMWETVFSPVVQMADATLQETKKRVHMFEALNSEDMTVTNMFKYLPYYPDIVKSAVNNNITELIAVLSKNDSAHLSYLLCNKTQWKQLNMSAGDAVEDLKQFICETNIEDLFWDLVAIADPLDFLADIEKELYQNLQSGIDWLRMAQNLQYMYSTLSGENGVYGIFQSIIPNDLKWITNYYTVILDSLTTMTTTEPAQSPDSSLVEGLESLDEALAWWDLWNRVKHYALTWNLLAKVMNRYGPLLNDPNWNITSYLSDISPTLGGLLSEATVTMPEVIKAIEYTARKPELLADRLNGLNYEDFCADTKSLSMILGLENTPELIQLQNDLCTLDWSMILSEVEDSDKNLGSFVKQWEVIMMYNTSSLPQLTLNWTDIVTTTQKFAENVNAGLFNSFMPDLSMFGLSDTNSSISDLSSTLQNTWSFDITTAAGAIDQLMNVLYNMDSTNDTYAMAWQYSMASSSYLNLHLFKFINIHLGIINSTRTFNLSAHLNSPQADKVLQLLEQTPEINAVLLKNLQTFSNNGVPSKWLSVNVASLCNDREQFEAVLEMPPTTTLTRTEVVDAVCSAVDFEKLIEELRTGMEGLDDLIIAVENIVSMTMSASDMMVDYTTLAPLLQHYMDLLNVLMSSPITSVGLPLSNDGDLEEIQRQFEQFLMDLDNTTTYMVTPLGMSQLVANSALQSLNDLQDMPWVSEILQVSQMYMRVIRAMMNESIEMIKDPSVGFADYPEMYKMWKLMDMLPQLYAVFSYTSMVDSAKITKFTEAVIRGPEALCKESPSDLMTDIPILNIRFEEIFNLFCSVNFTELEKEATLFIHAEDISETYDSLRNGTKTGSIEAWTTEYNHLTSEWAMRIENADVMQMFVEIFHFVIPGYTNATLWDDINKFLASTSETYDPMKLLELNQNQLLQSIQNMLGTPDMDGIIHISETYMIVLTAMMDKSGEMLTDPAVGFQDYPEMYKMWKFMDWLPQLYTVFSYTSLVDNQKISYFFEALMQGPENLCMKQPFDLMTDPPVMNISFELILTDFCSINITALEDEMSAFIHAKQIGEAYDSLRANVTNQTSVESWSAANQMLTTAIQNFINQSQDFKWPDFYNDTLWMELMMFLNEVTMNNNIMDMVTDSSNNFMQILSTTSPDFQLQMKITDISYDIMEMMLDRLENMNGSNLADIFYGYGEIQKLMLLLQDQHIVETLAYSLNSPQFTELLSMGDEDAVINELCTSDMSKYFSVPPSVSLNLSHVQEKLCAIDLNVLAEQFSDMVMVDEIMNKISSNYTIDWNTMNERNRNISARIEGLITNPPMIDLPSEWMNETFWLDLLMLLNGPQTTAPLDPSVEGFLQQLQTYLGNEYKTLLEQWGPVALQLSSMIDMNMEAKKAFATVDLVLDFLNMRMKEVSDNVTVATLSKNSTDIVELMEALEALRNVLTSGNNSFDESVDAEMLTKILSDPDMLMSQCESHTAAMYIAMNGTETVITQALAEVICFDPNRWQQVLEDQIQQEKFETMLMEIWNVSNTDVILNWTSVSNNIETFVTIFMNWIEAPPTVNNNLMQWANWDGALEFLNDLYSNPNLFMNILNPSLGIPNEVALTFNKLLTPYIRLLTSGDMEELFSDPAKFIATINSIMSIEDWFTAVSSVYQAVENDMTKDNILESFVCGASEYDDYREYLMQNYSGVFALCGLDHSLWNSTLISYGNTESNLEKIQEMFNYIVNQSQADSMNSDELLNVLTGVFKQLNISMLVDGYLWTDWLASLSQQSLGRDDYMSLLELMESEEMMNDFNSMLLVIVEVENYIDMMLNNITGNNSVPLVEILPDADSLAKLINDFANSGSFSTLLMSSVDPVKFLTMMLSDDWNKTVCNQTLFQETFFFQDNINSSAIQHDLCTNIDAQYYVTEFSKAIDIRSLLLKIEEIVGADKVNASSETWNYMTSMLGTIISKMFQLDRVDMYGMDTWEGTMLDTLQRLMDTSTDESLQNSCDQLIGSLQGVPGLSGYLDSIDSFIQISYSIMKIQINMNTAVCETDTSDIEAVLDELVQLGVAEELAKVTGMLSGQTTKFSCDGVSVYARFIEEFIASITKAFNEGSKLEQCVTSAVGNAEDLLMDLSKLFNSGSQIVQILENEDIQTFLSQLTGANISTSMLNDIIDIYNQQENAVKDLMNVLENDMTELSATLQRLVASTTESIFRSLNMTYLQTAVNLTADELIESLCSNGDIRTLDAELNRTLCGDNKQLAQEIANTLLEYSTTLESLQNMAEYDSASFWDKVSKDISALVGNIEGLTSIATLVEQLGTVDITNLADDKELLKLLQRVLVDNGPDAFLNNLNALMDTFSLIDNDEVTNALLQDINILADGVFAFSSLRRLALANVKITDLVKDTSYLKTYMMETLALSENVTNAILEGSISIEVLISAAEVNITNWVCDSTKLEQVLQFDNSSITNAREISEEFCAVDLDTMSLLVEELVAQLDIGDFIEDLILNSGKLFNISMEETKDAVQSLITANDDLQSMTKKFNDFAETIPEAFAGLAVAQTGQQEFGSFSAILCGTQMPMIRDEFDTGSVIQQSKDLSESQQRELDSLPGAACKDMYVKIMQDKYGPIIWAYLKPLMRGKLLYTPKTPAVDLIIQKINSSFASLEEFVDLAESWAEGSLSLVNISGDNSRDLQDILNSNLVQGMLTELAGVSPNSLNDLLYTLENTDMNMMKGISKIADMIQSYISCVLLNRFEGFDDEESMEVAAAKLARSNELLAGLVFDTSGDVTARGKRDTANSLPHHIHYTIRMDIDNVPDSGRIKERMWRPQPNDDFFSEMRYFRGFIQLQDMVDQAIISLHGNVSLSASTTKQLPFPCHTYDTFVNVIAGYLLNVVMTLSWLAGISVAVYNLVYDRERGQEETLVAMGMKSGLNWIAWFFTTVFIMAIVAIIDVLLLSYGNIFSRSNIAILYLYFLDFILSTIMLSYFVSAFFTRTSLAILATVIVYIVSYLPFVVLYILEVNMKFWHKTLACLSSTAAFSYAAQFIARYEEQNTGLNWNNINSDPMNDDGFSFSWCCIMIAIDAGIYFVLGWYVRTIKPGKFGVAEPWYFIVTPSFWCGRSRSSENRYAPSNDGAFVEETNNPSPVVLSARGLSKTYSDGTQAVKNLNMDIHAGNVTTILGHNGAAKTTTMNMMIGILQPTEGEIRISNRPLKAMKGRLGVCSQHNALYEYMTVQEHMEFYSSVKGSYIGSSAKDEVRKLLKDVDLWMHRDVLVKKLSGGMQRRLCVALSFVGGSRAVVLDEPTSGVDPSGRRAIWNLIIQRKTDSAVLLSTHHLDEADIISDQIAIMHEGRMMCSGSPMFLKHHLASGHRLVVTKRDIEDDTMPISSVIKKWIPGSTLQQTAGAQLTFILPSVKDSDFYGLFKDLENQSSELSIVSYGISDPKLEEVFLKVCSAADAGMNVSPESLKQLDDNLAETNGTQDAKFDMDITGSHTERQGLEKNSGSRSTFTALFGKRFHHYRRDWRIVLSVLILPLLMVLLACGLYKVKPEGSSYPSIYLSPAMYGPDSYVFVRQHSNLDIGESILKSFMTEPGIGTSCMKNMDLKDPYKCVTPDSGFSMPDYDNTTITGKCTCENEEYKCVGSPYGIPPEQMVTTTTDIMQNLKDREIVDYLLTSFPEFQLNRFGGWSLSDVQEGGEMKLKATIWYNNQGFHSLPAFFNAFSNGLLRSVVNDSAETYGISTSSHPFVFSEEPLSKHTIIKHAADMGIATMILLAFTFIPVGILMYSVNENVNKEKHMQFVNGVTPLSYWIAALLWDLLVLGVAIGVSVLILLIFKPGSFWDRQNLAATVCLLALYGWSTITFVYMVVKRFRTSGAAFFTIFCTLMFIGIITILLVFSFDFFSAAHDNEIMGKIQDVVQYVFLVFPPYALGGGLLDLIGNHLSTIIYARFDTDVYKDPFTFDMIGWNLFAMGIEGLIFFVLTIWMDLKFCCSRKYERPVKDRKDEDEDVMLEKKRVDSGDCRQDVVIVRNLHKIYDTKHQEVHAVNGLSFGVPQGQCFGLLGINGAGKSTTFNILTGMLDSSCGSAYILNKRIEPGTSTVGDNLGYCPQDDALDPYLSILNTLNFHVKLKCLSGDAAKRAVEKVMNKLELNEIKNKLVKSCSGGMKRRLSLAIALLGDPAVVLLDEPTSGMDPKARRLVWNCLLEAKQNGQAIILTSHSLEECDVLCDRIGIMVNGEFKCLGSSQHLKQKYGDGYTVMLYMDGVTSSSNNINDLINAHFPGTTVNDQHVNVVQLDIPRDSMRLADVFAVLEQEKGDYNIIYYTVSQTTLDTIFLNFARDQTEGARFGLRDRRSSDADSLSTPPSSSASNPFYARVNPSLVGDSDKEKGNPETVGVNPAYILPAKNTFVDDQEAYSTKF